MDRHSSYPGGPYGHGPYGNRPDRPSEESAVLQMKKTYWTAKHTFMKKIGKKEDEHIVASDAELDAKLELFKQIEKSSISLQKVIERYQSRLFVLSREEDFLGQFLKGQGQEDKTRAGKMMVAVGKSECFSAAQRTLLRSPLYRLYHEVETFRCRAVADTLITVRRMEEARNEYRGALLWMKDVSEELDPDTSKQMEKFRKVQSQVKQAKAKFDRFKLDVMQKVDLLAASRSNMFSHALAAYQAAMLSFWENTSRLMTAASDCFTGYQYYEFNMLKELEEPSRKLVEQTAGQLPKTPQESDEQGRIPNDGHADNHQRCATPDQPGVSEVDQLIRDILASIAADGPHRREEADLRPSAKLGQQAADREHQSQQLDDSLSLIDLESKDTAHPGDAFAKEDVFGDFQSADDEAFQGTADVDSEQALLLHDVLEGGESPAYNPHSTSQDLGSSLDWGAMFSAASDTASKGTGSEGGDDGEFDMLRCDSPLRPAAPLSYLPSNLLDLGAIISDPPPYTAAAGSGTTLPALSPLAALTSGGAAALEPAAAKEKRSSEEKPATRLSSEKKASKKKDLSPWYNLFADLDPLSNPDAVGKKVVDTSDQA